MQAMELPHADNWKLLHDLEGERRLCVPAIIEGKLFCVGGYDKHANPVKRIERVDVPIAFDRLGRVV